MTQENVPRNMTLGATFQKNNKTALSYQDRTGEHAFEKCVAPARIARRESSDAMIVDRASALVHRVHEQRVT